MKFIHRTFFHEYDILQRLTFIKSSDEYKYLSICVNPPSTSHNNIKPSEAVALNIPVKKNSFIHMIKSLL